MKIKKNLKLYSLAVLAPVVSLPVLVTACSSAKKDNTTPEDNMYMNAASYLYSYASTYAFLNAAGKPDPNVKADYLNNKQTKLTQDDIVSYLKKYSPVKNDEIKLDAASKVADIAREPLATIKILDKSSQDYYKTDYYKIYLQYSFTFDSKGNIKTKNVAADASDMFFHYTLNALNYVTKNAKAGTYDKDFTDYVSGPKLINNLFNLVITKRSSSGFLQDNPSDKFLFENNGGSLVPLDLTANFNFPAPAKGKLALLSFKVNCYTGDFKITRFDLNPSQ